MTMAPLGTSFCQPTHLEKEFWEDKQNRANNVLELTATEQRD